MLIILLALPHSHNGKMQQLCSHTHQNEWNGMSGFWFMNVLRVQVKGTIYLGTYKVHGKIKETKVLISRIFFKGRP